MKRNVGGAAIALASFIALGSAHAADNMQRSGQHATGSGGASQQWDQQQQQAQQQREAQRGMQQHSAQQNYAQGQDQTRSNASGSTMSSGATGTTAQSGSSMQQGSTAAGSGTSAQGTQPGTTGQANRAASGQGMQGGQAAQSGQGGMSGQGSQGKQAAMLVLVPIQSASNENFANGCWARLYEDENYRGNALSVVGPVDLPNASPADGFRFARKYDSVLVGPNAQLTVYDNENFQQRTASFKPGSRVADLSEKMGFFENIRSLRVVCGR